MITFDPYETKKLSVPVRVKGMQSENLNFYFVIKDNDIFYSFPADKIEENKVSIQIPPLNNIIQNIKPGTYNAHIEVNTITENYKGFYMKPWENQIKIKESPDINVESVSEESSIKEKEEERTIEVGSLQEENLENNAQKDNNVTSSPKKDNTPEKKKTKISEFLMK